MRTFRHPRSTRLCARSAGLLGRQGLRHHPHLRVRAVLQVPGLALLLRASEMAVVWFWLAMRWSDRLGRERSICESRAPPAARCLCKGEPCSPRLEVCGRFGPLLICFLGFCLRRLSRAHLGVMVCGRFGPLLEFGFLGFGFVKVEPCSPGFWEARLLPTYPQGLVLSWSWAHVWFEV